MGFIGHLLTKIIAWFVGAGIGLVGALMMFAFATISPVMVVVGLVLLIIGLLIIVSAARMLWVN